MSKKNEMNAAATVNATPDSSAAVSVTRKAMSVSEFLEHATIAAGSNRHDDEVYRNIEISNVTAENKSLAGMEFHFSRLAHAKFKSCKLNRSEFKFAELEDVEFRDCSVECSYFNFAKFRNVRFVNCILDSSEFDFTNGDVSFENCSLKNAEFPGTEAKLCILRSACLRAEFNACSELNITAENSSFQRAEFNGTNLCGTMKECSMLYAEFNGSDGSGCKFIGCNMYRINADDAVGIGSSSHGEIDEELENFLDSIDTDEDEDKDEDEFNE